MNPSLWPRLALLALSLGLGACTTAPMSGQWPLPPDILAKSFNPLPATPNPGKEMETIDKELTLVLNSATQEARTRGKQDWSSGDTVTAGGIMAVLGSLADKTGLLNTGAGLALAGGTAKTRYQYDTQRKAYIRAEEGFSCVQTQVRRVSDLSRAIVLTNGAPEEKLLASKLPLQAIDAVNKVRRRLVNELNAIASDAPSRQDIESLAAKYQQAKTPGPAVKSLTPDQQKGLGIYKSTTTGDLPDWVVEDARNAVKAMPAELERCVL